jgi:predicted outer membrane protein
MTRRWLVVATVASLALLSTGCAAELDETPQQTAAATQSGPDPEALLERLGEIDPGLDDEASVADADELCLEVEAGESDAALAETARSLFGERAETELTDAQVESVVETVKGDYCG